MRWRLGRQLYPKGRACCGGRDRYNGRFELYDSEGNVVDVQTLGEGVYLNENFVDETGAYALKTVVYVDRIAIQPLGI